MLEKFSQLQINPLIADKPAEPRDSSNLMIVNRDSGKIIHEKFFNIGNYLRAGDCIVLNESKVWKAKIYAKKTTGAKTDFLLISPLDEERKKWKLLCRKAKTGDIFEVSGNSTARCIALNEDGSFSFDFSIPLTEKYLEEFATVPLPVYIEKKRKEKGLDSEFESDPQRYQTVYASKTGSIAAPTAGFHFTENLLKGLSNNGVLLSYVTLHIGWGTFRPVRSQPQQHKMLEEECEVSLETASLINKIKASGSGRIVAVGTSSIRTLEKMSIDEKTIKSGKDLADMFIYPGYKFKIPDVFITNFHVANSPPLFMTAAFCGEDLLFEAYKQAVEKKYRFYSYGDSMMIL